ncbi:anti-repressor SinI family protein [Anaerobacillus sp. MEB173]|uniref:anti-repressor SinI family protein n=1 Tax=Anaerobacillus sp. MEB173 TaxID=3383345 RepID=UPI003F8E87B0
MDIPHIEVKNSFIDREWLRLLIEAKKIGLTPAEIRKFLNENKETKKGHYSAPS